METIKSFILRVDVVTKDTEDTNTWFLSGSIIRNLSNNIIKELADLFSLNDSEMVTPSCIKMVCGHLPKEFDFFKKQIVF